jgi:glycosyltransferase involved in cell wall biosynthesis
MKFDTQFSGRIIQLVESLDYGDAVSNQVVALDGIFKRLGLKSAIYTKWFHEKMAEYREDLDKLEVNDRDVVILHFSFYAEHTAKIAADCYATRIILYHNITPAEFFHVGSNLHSGCRRGREQLADILPKFHYFWGDSEFNVEELKALGAAEERCSVVPIVIPAPELHQSSVREDGSWLFVGRIAPNKRQLELIDLFESVHREDPGAARRLFLVGNAPMEDPYVQTVRERLMRSDIRNRVILTGKVSDDERESHYARCSLFVSRSEHEGFGVPLIEAALRGVPVVGLNNTAVGETLGTTSGLATDIRELRKLAALAGADDSFRAKLLHEQQRNAQRFSTGAVERCVEIALRKVLPERRQFRTVSIIICTYNRRNLLERALDYLHYQTCPQFEVLVVDGPSDDGTKELLLGYEGRIKILHNPEKNLSKSRNLGIENAAGDIVAFIDDDAIPLDDWVETILNEYNSRSLSTAGLGGPVYFAGRLRYQSEDIGLDKNAEARVNIGSSEIGKNGLFRSLLGTNSTFTRAAISAIGGFDEQYDYFLDESDLCWRLQNANHLVAYTDRLLLRHEFAESANRRGKYNYNWYVICKNTAYFVAAYSGLQGEELRSYLRGRLAQERVLPLDAALNAGEITPADRARHVDSIWAGMERGLKDAMDFPRTRKLKLNGVAFTPYSSVASRLRVDCDVKRLHICIVSKEFPLYGAKGGIGTLYYHLASELILMGHEVTLVTLGEKAHTFQQGRFRVVFTKMEAGRVEKLDRGFDNNLNWTFSALAAIGELDRAHPIDVIESALWDAEALATALVSRPRRPPLVVRLVTPFPVAARINEWNVPERTASFFMHAERTLIERADAVVPISDSIADTIASVYSLPVDARWRVIRCGVPYWPLFDVDEGYSAFHGFENIPSDALTAKKRVVFLGRLEQRKGIDLLLSAAEKFLAKDSAAHLIVAGRDVEGWIARSSDILSRDVRSRVHFLGEVSDATRDKLLAGAYCLIFPSRYESFGLVPLEAFVHGVPVIASRSGAIPEVVVDGNCGLLFEPESAESLANVVTEVISNERMRSRLSAGARARVRELSSRKMARDSLDLYASLVA